MIPTTATSADGDGGVQVTANSNEIALTRRPPIFVPGSLRHGLMLAVIGLFPLQTFGIDVGTTKFDLSNIVFVMFVLSTMIGTRPASYSSVFKLLLGAYLAVEAIMFFAGPTTPSRFASAFLWLTSILLLFGIRDHVPVNARAAFWITLVSTVAVGLSLLFQYVFQGHDRPAGLMAEPSPAGLVLVGAAAGLLISARWSPDRIGAAISILGALCLFALSLLTKTSHILSVAIALVAIGLLSRSFSARTVVLTALLLGVLYWLVTYDPHYQSRVDIQGASANLSLLSWLQGFDQMVASLRQYPLTGAGLGATGQFDFYSPYTADLFLAGLGDLNRQDAFSGLFRLTIELGPVLMAAVLYAIGTRLRELWWSTGNGLLPVGREAQAQMFLFTFAFTLEVGILLKEPTYSRSHFVLAALLFSIVPLRAVVRLPRQVALQLRLSTGR